MTDVVYTLLFDVIDEHRECAGVHDVEERKAFVEQFMTWDESDRRYWPHPTCRYDIRTWAEELYSDAIDAHSHIGRRVMAGLLAGLDGVMRQLVEAIGAVADEVAEETVKNYNPEGDEVGWGFGEYQSGTD